MTQCTHIDETRALSVCLLSNGQQTNTQELPAVQEEIAQKCQLEFNVLSHFCPICHHNRPFTPDADQISLVEEG